MFLFTVDITTFFVCGHSVVESKPVGITKMLIRFFKDGVFENVKLFSLILLFWLCLLLNVDYILND